MVNQILDRRTIGIPGPAADASPELIAAANARAESAVAESLAQANIPGLVDDATGAALGGIVENFGGLVESLAALRGDVSDLVIRDGDGKLRTGVFNRGGTSTNILAARTDMAVDARTVVGVVERNGRAVLVTAQGTTRVPVARPTANSHIALIYWNPTIDLAEPSGGIDGSVFGVIYGTAAAVPVKPTLATAGAVEIGTVQIPSTATATNSGVSIATTAPYTTLVGLPIPVRSDAERDKIKAFQGLQISHLETGMIEQYFGVYSATNPGGVAKAGWYPVAGLLPAVSAYSAATQTYKTGVWTKVDNYGTSPVVNRGMKQWSAGVLGIKYTGLYRIFLSIGVNTIAPAARMGVQVTQNSTVADTNMIAKAMVYTQNGLFTVTDVPLNSGDLLRGYATCSAQDVIADAGPSNQFSAVYLGPA